MHPEYVSSLICSDEERTLDQWIGYEGKINIVKDITLGNIYCEQLKQCRSLVAKRKLTIAIMPTGLSKGYNTSFLYYFLLIKFIEKIIELGHMVIFKGKPLSGKIYEEMLENKFGNSSLFQIQNQSGTVLEALDECDVLVTDISTTAFDAAIRLKAVICLVDDLAYGLIKKNAQGFIIVKEIEKAIDCVRKLQDEKMYNDIIQRQNIFLRKLLKID